MKCVLCHKSKEEMSHAFKDETMLGKDFQAVVYTCDCPTFLFDELIFVRDEKKEFTQAQYEIFCQLAKQKKAMLISWDCKKQEDDNYFDIAMMQWRIYLRAGQGKKEGTEISQEVLRIHNSMWGLLYNL